MILSLRSIKGFYTLCVPCGCEESLGPCLFSIFCLPTFSEACGKWQIWQIERDKEKQKAKRVKREKSEKRKGSIGKVDNRHRWEVRRQQSGEARSTCFPPATCRLPRQVACHGGNMSGERREERLIYFALVILFSVILLLTIYRHYYC